MSEPFRKMNGSPEFYSLLHEMSDTHDKKSHDYASNDDPFGNYTFSGQLGQIFAHSARDLGFVTRIGEKLFRLANLEKSSKTPKNESVEDTERDLAVIMTLWMAARRQNRKAKEIPSEDALLTIIPLMESLGAQHLSQLRDYLSRLINDKFGASARTSEHPHRS